MERIRYRTLPSGLKQRIYEKNETNEERRQRLVEEREERGRTPSITYPSYRPTAGRSEDYLEGPVRIEREQGEEVSEYCKRLLRRGIQQRSNYPSTSEDDYIWY